MWNPIDLLFPTFGTETKAKTIMVARTPPTRGCLGEGCQGEGTSSGLYYVHEEMGKLENQPNATGDIRANIVETLLVLPKKATDWATMLCSRMIHGGSHVLVSSGHSSCRFSPAPSPFARLPSLDALVIVLGCPPFPPRVTVGFKVDRSDTSS